jgi:hypothetical protein
MARYEDLPSGLTPRGLTREAAAAYTGLSVSAFDKARLEQKYPDPTLPGGRFDRVLLDDWMNKLSGLVAERECASALEQWEASRNARAH